jgi:hypothetical protein
MREGDVSDSALFVTLTYDTEYVPITQNGFKNLSKHDVQKFFKRLRKIEQKKLKYFAVGEYGSKRMRPHYHIILYNANANNVHRAWALDGKMLGQIYIGNVSGASIGYTLKYMQKESKVPIHKNDDRQKEFQLMSKGLGKSYLTDRMIKWHKSDLEKRMYVPIIDGRKIPMPRYYKDKIYKESEKNRIARYIAKISDEQLEEEMNEYGIEYHYEMSQKHINAFRKMYKNSKQNEKLDI